MIRISRWVLCVAMAATVACATSQGGRLDSHGVPRLTPELRRDALARAHVWMPTDIPSRNLRTGPSGPGAVAPFADVPCTFVPRQLDGSSPKFACEVAPGDRVRIKYGADNDEVYAAVAASRLLWALGFGADRWYPVRVICRGCPADPFKNGKPATGEATFDIAALERPFGTRVIETHNDQGWDWTDLGVRAIDVNPDERDALRLLAVFLQHTDSKSQQQRLVCLDDVESPVNPACRSPFMYLHDVGKTFGKATMFNSPHASSTNFENWSRKPIWDDRARCVGQLSRSVTGTIGYPVIREGGRKFLADLLVQLSDDQLRDLFEVARFPQHSKATTDQWITAFKTKRTEIVSARCPS